MSSKYFKNFPLIGYNLSENAKPGEYSVVTNLFKRVRLHSSILNDARVYYPYQIKDGDTPENIAHRYYGSVDYHWIILLANRIIDPLRQWPKNYFTFLKYIIDQYGSVETAMSIIHHYNKTVTKLDSNGDTSFETTLVDQTEYNSLTNMVPVVYTFPDGSTTTVTTTRSYVDAYTFEELANEARRSIILLKEVYTSQIKQELEKLLGA